MGRLLFLFGGLFRFATPSFHRPAVGLPLRCVHCSPLILCGFTIIYYGKPAMIGSGKFLRGQVVAAGSTVVCIPPAFCSASPLPRRLLSLVYHNLLW